MINVKYQFIRRLLGISLSICTAYGAMRSAYIMAATPGTFLVAEAKIEQTSDIAEARADGTAASDEEANEFINEEVSEDVEEDVEVNRDVKVIEDIEAVEDLDQQVDEDVLKEEEAQIQPEPAAEREEEAQIQPEPEPEEPDVTLDDFLAGLRCGACGRCCSLLNPHCRRGMHKAQSAKQEYYETYAVS